MQELSECSRKWIEDSRATSFSGISQEKTPNPPEETPISPRKTLKSHRRKDPIAKKNLKGGFFLLTSQLQKLIVCTRAREREGEGARDSEEGGRRGCGGEEDEKEASKKATKTLTSEGAPLLIRVPWAS